MLVACVAGVVHRVNRVVSVRPVSSRYVGEVGDVVVELNGAPVADMGALIVDARMLEPGDEASLRVWRSEKLMLLTVKVGELD